MSLTRLLMRGWSIETGDETGIYILDGDGNKVAFDIVIPTTRGAVFACRFIRNEELNAVSTEKGITTT